MHVHLLLPPLLVLTHNARPVADFFRKNIHLRIVLEFEVGNKVQVEFCIINLTNPQSY
jgi:hypothetical protein